MKVLEDLCEALEMSLKPLSKKDDLTPQELDNAYKAMDIIKDIETVKAMRGESYGSGGGYDYSNRSYDSYARWGRDGDGDGVYNESRNSGRMSRNSGYDSGHGEVEKLKKELEELKRQMR